MFVYDFDRFDAADILPMFQKYNITTFCAPPTMLRMFIKVDLENEILAAIMDGYTTFITGMAYGTDIWAGSIVVRLKDRYPDIKLIAAIPFPEFSNNWDEEWKKKYDRLLASADLVKVICPEYHDGVYQLRNQWMVNHCSRLIGIYNGQPGGTRNTINYARSAKLTVKCLRG